MFKVGQKVYAIHYNRVISFHIDRVVITKGAVYYESKDLVPNFTTDASSVYRTKKEAYLRLLDGLYASYKRQFNIIYDNAKKDRVKLDWEV